MLPLFKDVFKNKESSHLISPYVWERSFDLIDMGNVAEYYYNLPIGDSIDLSELPSIRGSSDITWLEYDLSGLDVDFSKTLSIKDSHLPKGLLGGAKTMTINRIGALLIHSFYIDPEFRYGDNLIPLPDTSHSALNVYLYQQYKLDNLNYEIPSGGNNGLTYILDRDGAIVLLDKNEFSRSTLDTWAIGNGTPKAIFYTESDSYMPLGMFDRSIDAHSYQVRTLIEFSKPFLLANCFLSSKNVVLIDKSTRDKLKGKPRKIKRIGKKRKPTIKRKNKIIAIKPIRTKLRVKSDRESGKPTGRKNSRLKPHFRTYTKDRPMFGVKGRYGTYLISGFNHDKEAMRGDYIIKLV